LGNVSPKKFKGKNFPHPHKNKGKFRGKREITLKKTSENVFRNVSERKEKFG
jgi:hypothetical protein